MEPAGANCAGCGTLVRVGLDASRDSVLDASDNACLNGRPISADPNGHARRCSRIGSPAFGCVGAGSASASGTRYQWNGGANRRDPVPGAAAIQPIHTVGGAF